MACMRLPRRSLPYRFLRAQPNCGRVVRPRLCGMSFSKTLAPEDKLDALRNGDPGHRWESLDDRRFCIVCDKTFSGRQVEASVSASGRVRLRCPGDACTSTPREWVRPAKPLLSRKAWQDWSRVLEGKKKPALPGAQRQLRAAH